MTRVVAGRPAQRYDEPNESAFRREVELASLRTDQRLQAIDRQVAPLFPVSAFGAVGDGITDDSDALEAAITTADAVKGTLVFAPGATYLLSRTIYGAQSLKWEFNRTVFLADPGGTYDNVLDLGGADTGVDVFFATDGAARSSYGGRLSLDGNGVANLCGISAADASASGQGQGMQTWEHLRISNFERGIFALNQGPQGRTLVGNRFGIVEFLGNTFDMWLDGDGADDAVFDVVRSQSTIAGGDAIRANNSRGVTIRSLFINPAGVGPPPSPARDGIVIFNGSTLFCDHVFLEDDFARPIVVGQDSNLIIKDLKLSTGVFLSDNGQVITITENVTACVVDVVADIHLLGAPNVTHLVEIEANNTSTYGRVVRVRMPLLTTDVTPVVYTGVGASDNDNVVVYAEDGHFRYFYDGSVLTTLREPLVNGTTTAATTLGSVTDRMEVFDPQGNSLGFVPIYDTIT